MRPTGPLRLCKTILANPSTGQPCAAGSTIDGKSCTVIMSHSCTNSGSPFFADPAVRINQVRMGMKNSYEFSICDSASDFDTSLAQLGQAIGARLMRPAASDGGCS